VQGLVNVARDDHLIGPVSLNILVIAQSGERKTSADHRLSKAIREWENEEREARAPDIKANGATYAAWEAERDGLLSKIKSNADKPKEKLDGLKADLQNVDLNRPSVLPNVSLFNEDVTPEGLSQHLASGWPSSSLWSDEGGLIVGSHGMGDDSAMRYFALLNRMWDGHSFERKRTTAKSFIIEGRRLTCSLMMQETVMARLLGAAGGVSRGIGFMARFLIAWPASTMGKRPYRSGDMASTSLLAFDSRIREILGHDLPTVGDNMALEPQPLHLSTEAMTVWINFHDEVEQSLGGLGEFQDVKDFAAKTAENAVRIAAIFHVFEHGPSGHISDKEIHAGAKLAAWHLWEARRALGAFDTPQEISDAMLLVEWLIRQGGGCDLTAIGRLGPNQLRKSKTRRSDALKLLVTSNWVAEMKISGRTSVRVNPKVMKEAAE
ncbi:MAG: DUF3987 domain-containing protein, partial [Rhodospirillaceae bacterium]|nr:DUF3987 domain-containing protein [Rhodospirillaceae bacterium]